MAHRTISRSDAEVRARNQIVALKLYRMTDAELEELLTLLDELHGERIKVNYYIAEPLENDCE